MRIKVRKTTDVRQSFVAPKGFKFVKADLSQIEYRVLASLAGEQSQIEAFRKGVDFHTLTYALATGIDPSEVTKEQRKVGKTTNFAINYGANAGKLAQTLGCSVQEAAAFIDSYFAAIPNVVAYKEFLINEGLRKGYTETFFGRRREIPTYGLSGYELESAHRKMVNTVIQGTAADILKIAMLRVSEAIEQFGSDCQLVLTVHDELDFYIRESRIDEVCAVIKRAFEIPVPPEWAPVVVDIEVGDSWSSKDLEDWVPPESYKPDVWNGWGDVLPKSIEDHSNIW